MDRKKIAIVAVILCACVAGGLMTRSGQMEADVTTSWGGTVIVNKDTKYPLGDMNNPFTVLEIVPNHEMSQFGYFIPGCEPIDMDRAKYHEDVWDALTNVQDLYDVSRQWEYAFYDQIPASEDTEIYYNTRPAYVREDLKEASTKGADGVGKCGQWINSSKTDYSQRGDYLPDVNGSFVKGEGMGAYVYVGWEKGNYQKNNNVCTNVGAGNGNYVQDGYERDWNGNGTHIPEYVGEGLGDVVKDPGWDNYEYKGPGQGDYVFTYVGIGNGGNYKIKLKEVGEGNGDYVNYAYVEVGEGNGDYAKQEYQYVGAGNGNYSWVPSEKGAVVRTPLGDADLFECPYLEFNHKDEFIQGVKGKSSKDYHSQVIVLTPAELEVNTNLIETADLIYIHGESGDYAGIANAYHTMHGDEGSGTVDAFLDGGASDLTYTEVKLLMERMASSNPAAVILDMTKMMGKTDQQKELNCHKLVYMLLMYEPKVFWNTFGPYIGSYTGWDGYQKIMYSANGMEYKSWETHNTPFETSPTGADMTNKIRYENINSGGWNVFNKIFTFDGSKSLLQELIHGGDIGKLEKTDGDGKNVTIDYFNDPDNAEKTNLTFFDAVKFILDTASYTPVLRVLELQGCDEFIYGSEGWETYYGELHPWYKPGSDSESWVDTHFEVTTMPTWEFIGSNGSSGDASSDAGSDDLTARYDLIIIGGKQLDSNGLGGYNMYTDGKEGSSVDLGNLIYTAIGGTYSTGDPTELSSDVQSEYLDMRHAGNDITLKKLLELQNFQKAGKVVIVDTELCSGGAVDPTKVDVSSKMYEFLTGDGSHRYVYGTNKTQIHEDIKKSYLGIEFGRIPKEYQGIDSEGNTDTADDCPDNLHADYKVLDYRFVLRGEGDYHIALYLDTNGDGVYAGSQKEKKEVDGMKAVWDGSLEYSSAEAAQARLYFREAGSKVWTKWTAGMLAASMEEEKEYEVRCYLDNSIYGIVPWKLELWSDTNDCLRTSAVGYTLFKPQSDDEKVTIRVLQMNPRMDMSAEETGVQFDFTSFTRWSIVVKEGESYADFDRRNPGRKNMGRDYEEPELDGRIAGYLSANMLKTVQKFEDFLVPVKEFDVKIHYLFNDDWYQLFGSGAGLENWKDFLADYDMLVFGFQDMCSFSEDSVFVQGVQDFIDQGKSMIMSHDMLSAFAINDGANSYGEDDAWLRTVSGQRRAFYIKGSDGKYVKSYNEVMANGEKVSFVMPDNLEPLVETDEDGNETTQDNPRLKYFAELGAAGGDSADASLGYDYVNEWADNETYNQVCAQGTSGLALGNRERGSASNNGINGNGWEPGGMNTTFVKLTNRGQITNYPYMLNDVIEVLGTHTQYYQLDLEYQKQGDVNVWFTLSDVNDPEVAAYAAARQAGGTPLDATPNSEINIYSQKDKDARNSFYIYNKGNITYTGSGHGFSNNWQNISLMTDDEVKLFINTMISAFRQPESRPYVLINNADAVAADRTSVVYLDYDGDSYADGSEKAPLDVRMEMKNGKLMVRIECTLCDTKPVTDEGGSKQYYIVVQKDGTPLSSTEVVAEGGGGWVNDEGINSYHVGDSSAGGTYPDGYAQNFVVYVPYDDIKGSGSAKYAIGAYAKYEKNHRTVRTTCTNSNVMVMLLPLFDLN